MCVCVCICTGPYLTKVSFAKEPYKTDVLFAKEKDYIIRETEYGKGHNEVCVCVCIRTGPYLRKVSCAVSGGTALFAKNVEPEKHSDVCKRACYKCIFLAKEKACSVSQITFFGSLSEERVHYGVCVCVYACETYYCVYTYDHHYYAHAYCYCVWVSSCEWVWEGPLRGYLCVYICLWGLLSLQKDNHTCINNHDHTYMSSSYICVWVLMSLKKGKS